MVVVMLTTLSVLFVLAVVALITFLIGLYDRPKITQGLLLSGIEDDGGKGDPGGGGGGGGDSDEESGAAKLPPSSSESNKRAKESTVFAIVATSSKPKSRKLVTQFAKATREGIESLDNGAQILEAGSKAYLGENSNQDDESQPVALSVAFFYDRTNRKIAPRWAIGWIVRDDKTKFEELQALVNQEKARRASGLLPDGSNEKMLKKNTKRLEKFKKKSGLGDELRVIRLAGDMPVLRASFPWRTFLTPTIAAMMQWGRSYKALAAEKHDDETTKPTEQGPVAMEVYVQKPKCCSSYVDFNLVWGSTGALWNDVFPGNKPSMEGDTAVVEKPS